MQVGDKVNFLTLKEETKKVGSNKYGIFECECGSIKEIRITAVSGNNTKSCGCHRKKQAVINSRNVITHGQTNHFLYRLWARIKQQCTKGTKYYLGFSMFKDWYDDYAKFSSHFINLGWEEGLTISRKDFNLPFDPDNCILLPKNDAKTKSQKHTCQIKYNYDTPLQNEKVKEKIKKTCLEKYGFEKASKSDIVKQNTINNNTKKYGVNFPQLLPSHRNQQRKLAIDNGQAKLYEGKTITQWAHELGFSHGWFGRLIDLYGFEYAKNYEKKKTLPAQIVKEILDGINVDYKQEVRFEKQFADFLLEDYKLIIEADGLFWHSDAINKDKNYHFKKKELYSKYGYKSLFFREDELLFKINIVKSIINNKLNRCDKIYARKCKLEKVKFSEIKDWLNINHLMGVGIGDAYILKYDNEIVCCMQVVNYKKGLEIDRFCTKLNTSIIGGFSKLLKQIEKDYNKDIFTFIDQRYGYGDYLLNFGFEKITNYPSFKWTKNLEVLHRMKFPGNSGYDQKYYKIWDCGQTKYIKKAAN